jgi:hypothetical protein
MQHDGVHTPRERACAEALLQLNEAIFYLTVRREALQLMGAASRDAGVHGMLRRCGRCAACARDACGRCRECLDAPRFGGPGKRKRQCVMRICTNMGRVGK